MADYAGITPDSIRGYEKGEHQPPLDVCIKMAEFLGCSLERLADWETDKIIDKRILQGDKLKLVEEVLNLESEKVSSVLAFIELLNKEKK